MADAFTFQTDSSTDTVSAVTVSLGTGAAAGLEPRRDHGHNGATVRVDRESVERHADDHADDEHHVDHVGDHLQDSRDAEVALHAGAGRCDLHRNRRW